MLDYSHYTLLTYMQLASHVAIEEFHSALPACREHLDLGHDMEGVQTHGGRKA